MNKSETMDYIRENFDISQEALRLIYNILSYVECLGLDENDQYVTLCLLLNGAIGLTDNEIKKIVL